MIKPKLLITGYSGFVGHSLLEFLKDQYEIFLLGRSESYTDNCHYIQASLETTNEYNLADLQLDFMIHCAARVHVMNDSSTNPLEEFREVNTYGTLNLAQQAADAGVKRFIFISSIKVNGESTELGSPFKPDDDFIPIDPYGLSKYEAEVGLREIAKKTGMQVVIIRPPLVYGPGVKANFAAMMKWVYKGIPLPLGGITENKRSLVSVDNLVDLIITCIEHPNAANQTFLVSDDADVSTTGLLKNMAKALNVPSRLIPVPASWIEMFAKMIGKNAISQRLCGSLQVDISKTKNTLNWKPPHSSAVCMKKTAEAFIETLNK
jgi:nucleoside-diphosphate-sugar epimerase